MKSLCILSSVALLFATVHSAQGSKPLRWPAELVAGNNQFALDLYHRLSSKADQPLFFSPCSISTALAMTYAGARGDTATEMAKTLHFTLPPEKLQAAYGSSLTQLTSVASAHGYQLRIANRLWGHRGHRFLDSFLKITRDDYGAEVSQLDFVHQTEQSRATINAWVEKQTNDKIKDLIPAGVLKVATRLVLTNAIYFKGDWQQPFDKKLTQQAVFHLTADKTGDQCLMKQRAHFRFARTGDLLLLEMPYQSGDLSMVVLLPAKVDGLQLLERSFTLENYEKWLAELRSQDVIAWIPMFQATQEIQLAEKLSAMGMPMAFSPEGADFSGMDGKRDLFISAVIHKAFVGVDEKGTEAAATTGISIDAAVIRQPETPEEFKADHPFIFLIRDTRSGEILFLGRFTGRNGA
jgi:serpin B